MRDIEFRSKLLTDFGANAVEIAELLAYNENHFQVPNAAELPAFPWPAEPHVAAWQRYAETASRQGVYPTLQQCLVQLRFPIQQGISDSEAYRAATRRGVVESSEASDFALQEPQSLHLEIYPTLAGAIPILTTGERQDFVSLVQALTLRNEPKPIPDSMGACMVNGYNNWDRIQQIRRAFEAQPASQRQTATWEEAFSQIVPQKQLYQDRFVILSDGDYSGVAAETLGLMPGEWRRLSLLIRREHECTHYFTLRVLGSMHNNLLDEIIADTMGIVVAAGFYRADWFLRFMGLENFPRFRSGGRLQNYRGQPALSDGAFQILQALVHAAAQNLARFDAGIVRGGGAPDWRAALILALTQMTLEDLASAQAMAFLGDAFAAAQISLSTGVHGSTTND